MFGLSISEIQSHYIVFVVWRPVSIIHLRFQIHSVLCFYYFFPNTNAIYFLRNMGAYVYFLIIKVTRQTSHLRICFSFSYNDPVTLCVIARGPCLLSIFYHPLYAFDVGAFLRCFQIQISPIL